MNKTKRTGPDEELLEQLQQGNRQALGKLYDKYAPALLGLISRMVPDRHRAEEVLRQTFMVLWEKAGTIELPGGRLFPWLLLLARKSALQTAASGTTEIRADENYVSMQQKQEDHDPHHCPALELVFFKGYDFAKAAGILGCTTDELKKQVRAELQQFRRVTA